MPTEKLSRSTFATKSRPHCEQCHQHILVVRSLTASLHWSLDILGYVYYPPPVKGGDTFRKFPLGLRPARGVVKTLAQATGTCVKGRAEPFAYSEPLTRPLLALER